MKIYRCIVRSFICDGAADTPDHAIAPGTRRADAPADRECPDCGVAKADFERVEV